MMRNIARPAKAACRRKPAMAAFRRQPAMAALGVGLMLALSPVAATPGFAEDMTGSIARGARLYDSWFKVIGADKPADTHQLWPASNDKKKGDVTWRCKSCHGWDLKGAEGAYAKGSYQTGIKGLGAYAGKDPAEVTALLKGAAHGYDGKMSDADLADLGNFVTMGQVDFAEYINYADKTVKGDAAKGEAIFQTVCVMCHGPDGKLPKDMEESVGLLSRGNPWEILHKILYGQPHEAMTPMVAFGAQTAADILAYGQTLPE